MGSNVKHHKAFFYNHFTPVNNSCEEAESVLLVLVNNVLRAKAICSKVLHIGAKDFEPLGILPMSIAIEQCSVGAALCFYKLSFAFYKNHLKISPLSSAPYEVQDSCCKILELETVKKRFLKKKWSV